MIHLAIISSEEYAQYAAATLLSVLKNMDPNRLCHIYILTEDITPQTQKKIEKLKHIHDFQITYLYFKETDFDILKNIKCPYYINRIAAARLLLPSFLPNLDKVVCIESDMIFRHDIGALYDTEIEQNYIGAVEDFARKIHAKDLWGNDSDIYFNTGVMVINLKKLRQIDYLSLIKEHIKQNGAKYKLQEQCIINDSYKGKIYRLNIHWNFYHDYYSAALKKRIQFQPVNEKEYLEATKDPWVVHTPGADKFWHPHFKHPYKKEYMQLYKQTTLHPLFKYMNYNIHTEKYKYITFYDIPIFSNIKTASKKEIKLLGIPFLKKTFLNQEEKRFFLGIRYYKKTVKDTQIACLKIIQRPNFYKMQLFYLPIVEKKDFSDKQYMKIFGIPVYFHNSYKKKLLDTILAIQKEQETLKETLIQLAEYQYQIMWLPQKVSTLHSQVFPQFKDIHLGKDVVIVGCGPTLYDYSPLPEAKHISLNRAFRYKRIKFDYAFIWDLPGMAKANDGCVEDFLNYDCIKFVGKFLSDKMHIQEDIKNNKGILYRCYSSARHRYQFGNIDTVIHADLSIFPLIDFMSISFGALHFASWTHAKRIFLVGCDTTTNGSFDGRQNSYHFKEIFMGYKLFKEFMTYHYPETEIISVNPIGLRGIFKDVYTVKFLKKHPEIKNVEILSIKE